MCGHTSIIYTLFYLTRRELTNFMKLISSIYIVAVLISYIMCPATVYILSRNKYYFTYLLKDNILFQNQSMAHRLYTLKILQWK